MLANAISIPLEMLNEGSDGLGSGKPAEVRLSLFALQNEAARRRFCSQFEQQFLRPIVEQYSPYDAGQDFGMQIKPFLDDKSDMAEYIDRVGKYMRNEDVVEKLDLPTIDDEEMAESYRPPKQIEEAEEEDQQQGGLFGSDPSGTGFRRLAEGYPISDPSECNGSVVEGPQGGLRCIPSGQGGGESEPGQGTDELSDGNPRREINTPDEAEEYLDSFDEDDFEYDHWRGGGNFDKVGEGSVVEVFTGEMGFEDELALVVEADGDEFTVVTADGEEKTMSPNVDPMDFDHTEEAPLADVWDDSANQSEAETEPTVEVEDVEDEPTWFEERDFEEEYGAPEDVDLVEGMSLEVGDEIQQIQDSTSENGVDYYQLDDGTVMGVVDGVLTQSSEVSRLDIGTEQHITWDEDANLEDGWYAVDDNINETDEGLMVELVDEDGETHEIDGEAVEREGLIDRKDTPMEADVIEPEMAGAHEEFDAEYPDSPDLDENVSLDNIEADLDETQRNQIERGLGKAQELGLTDSVDSVTEMDVGGEASGMTLGRFEPESGEIKINVDRMNQETLDSVGDEFAVGDSVEDMLVHESIHAKHAAELEEQGWTPEEMREELLRDGLPESEQEIMESEVSEYGAANPLEVVAEIGTKITRGEEVSDEALHLYEKYGGPEL
jgi:hypothetical protein